MPIVQLSDVGQGVNLDLTPDELKAGLWSGATNMRFVNGYAQRFNGIPRVFDATAITPYWLTAYVVPTKRYWVHAGTGKAYADDGTARVEITRLAEIAIASITNATTTATLTTSAAHGLTTGNSVTVYGAYPYAYNGTYTITVTGPTAFTYTMASNPGGSATTIGHLIGPGAAVVDFTGARDDRWTGGVLGGVLVMNNGVDVPQYWAGSEKLRTLHGWSSTWTAKILAPFKNYLLAFDVTKNGTRYPHMMKWSAAAVPGAIPHSWDSTDVTLDAGEVDIAETPDLLVDALPLGDALIVYKERSMYAVRYVGYPAIFAVQRLPGDSGMLFRGCGAMTPLGHVVLTAGDVVLNTGSGVQSIADGIVRKFIFRNIDSTNYKRAFVTTNPQRNEVLVCFPETGSSDCNIAAVWNWKDKTWGIRSIGATNYGATGLIDEITSNSWDSDSESWDLDSTTWNESAYSPNEARLLFAQTSRIGAFDVSSSDDGTTPVTGTLERTGIWLDDPDVNKLLRGIRPRIDTTAGTAVSIQLGSSMTPSGAVSWGAPISFTPGVDIKADGFAQGRFLAIRLSCAAPWRMRSVGLDVVRTGGY